MVVRRTLAGALMNMGNDAKSQFRILVKDFPARILIGAQVLFDKFFIDQNFFEFFADLLQAVPAGVFFENVMTVSRELVEDSAHDVNLPGWNFGESVLARISLMALHAHSRNEWYENHESIREIRI